MTTKADVERNIKNVNDEHKNATATLNAMWFKSSDTQAAINALKSLKGPIDAWAKRGTTAVTGAGMPPEKWTGWVKAGRVYIDGIHDQGEFGTKSKLTDIADLMVETAKDAPKQIVKAAKKTVRAAGEVVGTAASSIVTPILGPIAMLIGIAIAVLLVLHFTGVLPTLLKAI